MIVAIKPEHHIKGFYGGCCPQSDETLGSRTRPYHFFMAPAIGYQRSVFYLRNG